MGFFKKGQTISLDLIIGVVLFLTIVVVLYAVFQANSDEERSLKNQGDRIEALLDSQVTPNRINPPQVSDGIELSENNLQALFAMDYEDVKQELGLTDDFCLVVVDDTGGLVDIGSEDFGFGNGEVSISDGIFCD